MDHRYTIDSFIFQEKEEARKLFKSKKGKELVKELVKTSQYNAAENGGRSHIGSASAEEARAIREAVANATTLEEVERLNQMLKAGIVPGKPGTKKSKSNGKLIIWSGPFHINCYSLHCRPRGRRGGGGGGR
jgi:hypothetical protein